MISDSQRRAYRKVFEMVCALERRSPGKAKTTQSPIEVELAHLKTQHGIREGRIVCGTKKRKLLDTEDES